MASRTTNTARITLARLNGTAHRLLEAGTPRAQAVSELRAITTDPSLLCEAATSALAGWLDNPIPGKLGRDVAALLVDAGADKATVGDLATQRHRDKVEHRTRPPRPVG